MNGSEKFTISPQAMSRLVGEETVILDLASGTYFGLDPVGARMWTLLSEGKTIAEICSAMLEEYDVVRERLEADLMALVGQLTEQKLIFLSDP